MTTSVEAVATDLLMRAGDAPRFMVAIAGPPGAGKSTLAERLRDLLNHLGRRTSVLPMDGFHMDNGLLEERGLLPRKGAPETFDVRGFADIVRAVRQNEGEVLVPVFDRSRELAICAARAIPPEDRIVLVEGNYLLLDRAPWSTLAPLFDLTILVAPPVEELARRLAERWTGHGLDAAGIEWKLEGNDLPNGRLVLEHGRPADIVIRDF